LPHVTLRLAVAIVVGVVGVGVAAVAVVYIVYIQFLLRLNLQRGQTM